MESRNKKLGVRFTIKAGDIRDEGVLLDDILVFTEGKKHNGELFFEHEKQFIHVRVVIVRGYIR